LKKELSVSDSTSETQGSGVPENQSGSEQDAGPRVARLSARQRRCNFSNSFVALVEYLYLKYY